MEMEAGLVVIRVSLILRPCIVRFTTSCNNMTYLIPWPVYTFLATLVLLLAVSGAIVIRSFILRRRHRRMVEEAVRNGTYVPPTPPVRPARVDLSQKPELWEAYLGGGGWQPGNYGYGSRKELDISANWKSECSRDWECIKPLNAAYADPLSTVPCSGSTPSLSPPVFTPVPTPTNPSAPRGDDEENRRTAEVPSSLFSRARIFLNPNSASSPDNGTESRAISTNVSMTELSSNSPPIVRVSVLIAMPSPSSHKSFSPLSASLSSSLSCKAQPTTSHPLESSSSSSPTTTMVTDDEEHPLPHLEMGVADVIINRSENSSTWGSAHTSGEEKNNHSRGSSYAEP